MFRLQGKKKIDHNIEAEFITVSEMRKNWGRNGKHVGHVKKKTHKKPHRF